MRILIVKLSSLGDLIHTFPALTDATNALPQAKFDWLVDKSFSEVPTWHPGINQVIQINLRGWFKRGLGHVWQQWHTFLPRLRQDRYDLVIDAQGLLKSAFLAARVNGSAVGYDKKSLREPIASFLYQHKYTVPRDWHAIRRIRSLFAQALGYAFDEQNVNYALHFRTQKKHNHILLLHGTTWPSKLWPEIYWAELADLIHQAGFKACLSWHTPDERLRAERIIRMAGTGKLLPAMRLTEMAQCMAQSAGAVGVDSGLAHVAAALDMPAVTLYGATCTELTGAAGKYQKNLSADFECAPCMRRECHYPKASEINPACFTALTPGKVWRTLRQQMAQKGT